MGRKPNDLKGQRFGKLTVVGPTEERKHGYVMWECRCDCGSTVFVQTDKLRAGKVTSCGCKRHMDLTGQRFGRLTALRKKEERRRRYIVWECLCDCGKTTFVTQQQLVNGLTKSCGCLRIEHSIDTGKKNAKDLTGQRFGKLTAVRPTELRKNSFVVWECLCDCGETYLVTSMHLVHGVVKSCGCLRRKPGKENED